MSQYNLIHKKEDRSSQLLKTPSEFFKPALAWASILGLIVITVLFILAGFGKWLNYLFPTGALAVGILLYFKFPILYNGFLWWSWLISPLVRRLADYRGGGFTEPSPILLAPYLVTFISIITVLKNLPKASQRGVLPFLLTLSSLLFSLLIGLINRNPIQVFIDFLDWVAPILLGFHLFINWKNYPNYRQNTQRVFLWGVLLMGIYGIIQYIFLPEWDRFWMLNAEISSNGKPEPMSFRVWSTLNSGEPFAAWMAAALLLLLNNTATLQFPAMIVGYLSFLLTMVRSAWLGWIIGFFILWNSLKSYLQIRLIVIFVCLTVIILPLVTIAPFSDAILSRFSTFSNIEEDNSADARTEIYREHLNSALSSYLGQGLGGAKLDSNILALLLNLGWFGTIFYLSGLLLLVLSLFHGRENYFDPFISTSRAIIVSVLIRMPLNSSLVGLSGLVLWGFIGLGIAGKKSYHHSLTKKVIDPSTH